MSYYYDKNWVPNFNVRPVFPIKDTCSWKGNDAIVCALKDRIAKEGKEKLVVTFDYMYGFDESVLLEKVIKQLGAATLIDTNEAKYPEPVIQEKFGKYITEDRIMGVYIPDQVDAFFDPAAVEKQRRAIRDAKGLVVVYGVAAEVVCGGDVLVYCNVTEKTIGDRMRRKGLGNWGADNGGDEFLKRQKRNNFVEKRVLYWHRTVILPVIDYMMDCNDEEALVMVDRETFDKGVNSMAHRPYQSCPRWTESIWGGDWAQKVLGADPSLPNVGWATPGSAESLPIILNFGGNDFMLEGMDLIFYLPKKIIGARQLSWHGYRAPVSSNYLDTWHGQNLSLQVHPTKVYAQRMFNADTGHHESYYMMDTMEGTGDDSHVYLGVKTGVTLKELVAAFEEAQETGKFDDKKYLNDFPMKKHDHVYIPAGTVHASGTNTVVLEINCFGIETFKLWDWGRVDYDGKPRPINIEHGKHCINVDFNTEVAADELISKRQEVARGYGWRKEFSGTSPYAPYSVYRYWFTEAIQFETDDVIKMHVLVEGEEAIVESPNQAFEPYVFHYGETLYIPAAVGQYTIRPYGKAAGKECAIVEGYMNYTR